jgi:anthranilate phosphoribosyltransferase
MTNYDRDTLREFGWNIQRVLSGEHLTREKTRELFSEILKNQQPDLQQGAFLAALSAKGETADEIAGAWEAIVELDTTAATDLGEGPLVDNSGTGMDSLKTFNVSSAAAIVAASAGIRLARHGARGLTSACGTVDVLEALGIDVDCPVPVVSESIRRLGIGLFNGMSPEVHPNALGRILSQIRFGSTLNIAASLASPCRPTHALRGVHSVAAMEQVGAVMRAIGYQSALIVHGFNGDKTAGMDELSTLGESEVLELREDGSSTRYTITPESVGLPRANFEDIASSGNVDLEATRMLMVLAGKGHERRQDLVCLNAGALFYLVKRAPSIEAGIRLAHAQLGQTAINLLSRWTKTQATNNVQATKGFAKLRTVANLAGIPLS